MVEEAGEDEHEEMEEDMSAAGAEMIEQNEDSKEDAARDIDKAAKKAAGLTVQKVSSVTKIAMQKQQSHKSIVGGHQ